MIEKVKGQLMSRVYFIKVENKNVELASRAARKLLETIVAEENIVLENKIPIKTHFGEKGNRTFIKAAAYNGIIDYLKEQNREDRFLETTVLYGGKRFKRDSHLKLAEEHGFTALPVEIADGESGEELYLADVDLKHFKQCSIGKAFERYHRRVAWCHSRKQ